jgi:probable HAF family extracellular repeat protein
MMRRKLLPTSVLVLCLFVAPFIRAQVFTVTDLGTLGGSYSAGRAINDLGQVVGYSETADHSSVHAFLWSKSGGMQDLTPGPGVNNFSFASGINNVGEVAGVASFPVPANNSTCLGQCFQSHAFLWTTATGMQDLGTLGNYSAANGINLKREIVGDTAVTGGNSLDPFLWTKKGMQDLGTLGGGGGSAKAINNFGRVVGGAFTGDGFHAFLWAKSGGMQDLGTLGGCESQAEGITDFGQVVGGSTIAGCGGTRHAFLWTRQTGMQNLGTPPGTSFGGAGAINWFGIVVGSACPQPCLSQESVHAFMWSGPTGWVDLNSLIPADSGWTLENASGISAWGQITGQGFINGQYHAFLLTPNIAD